MENEYISLMILHFLKKRKADYDAQGLIPTLELLINDMENNLK